MQQFVVPQFIDVESKIIGPITARQFIECMVGGFILFLLYKFASFTFFLIFGVLDLIVTFALAFIKVNGVPFHYLILNMIQTFRKPALRVWNKELTTEEIKSILAAEKEAAVAPKAPEITTKRPIITGSLAEVSLVVDTGGAYKGEEGFTPTL